MDHHLLPHISVAPISSWSGHCLISQGCDRFAIFVTMSKDGYGITLLVIDLQTFQTVQNIEILLAEGMFEEMFYPTYDHIQHVWALAVLGFGNNTPYELDLYFLQYDAHQKLFPLKKTIALQGNTPYAPGMIHGLFVHENVWSVFHEMTFIDTVEPYVDLYVKHFDRNTGSENAEGFDLLVRLLLLKDTACFLLLRVDYDHQKWHYAISGTTRMENINNFHRNDFQWEYRLISDFLLLSHFQITYLTAHLLTTATLIPNEVSQSNKKQEYFVGCTIAELDPSMMKNAYQIGPKVTIQQQNMLCCIDSSGQLVHQSVSDIGFYLELCCCNSMVVGVDLYENCWRLWNWDIDEGSSFRLIATLPSDVCRVSIVANRTQSGDLDDKFWCIEEYKDRLEISLRLASTLTEVEPLHLFNGMHLCESQSGYASLDWHIYRDKISYCNSLILLMTDDDKQAKISKISLS